MPMKTGMLQVDYKIDILTNCILLMDEVNPKNRYLYHVHTKEILPLNPEGLKDLVTYREFKEFEKHKLVVTSILYDPHKNFKVFIPKNSLDNYVLNLYTPPEWLEPYFYSGRPAPISPLPEIYINFLTHFTGKDIASVEYILDWIATALQSKNICYLTTIGGQGIGKGVLGRLLQCIFSPQNCIEVGADLFSGRFNAQLVNRQVLYVPEFSATNMQEMSRVKVLANETIEIERKGQDPQVIKNTINLYLSSNESKFSKLDSSDRRFSIIELTDKKLAEVMTESQIHDLFLPENIAAIGLHCYTRKVLRDMRVSFKGDRFKELLEENLTDGEHYFVYTYCKHHQGQIKPWPDVSSDLKREFPYNAPTREGLRKIASHFYKVFKFTKIDNNHAIQFLGESNKLIGTDKQV